MHSISFSSVCSQKSKPFPLFSGIFSLIYIRSLNFPNTLNFKSPLRASVIVLFAKPSFCCVLKGLLRSIKSHASPIPSKSLSGCIIHTALLKNLESSSILHKPCAYAPKLSARINSLFNSWRTIGLGISGQLSIESGTQSLSLSPLNKYCAKQ